MKRTFVIFSLLLNFSMVFGNSDIREECNLDLHALCKREVSKEIIIEKCIHEHFLTVKSQLSISCQNHFSSIYKRGQLIKKFCQKELNIYACQSHDVNNRYHCLKDIPSLSEECKSIVESFFTERQLKEKKILKSCSSTIDEMTEPNLSSERKIGKMVIEYNRGSLSGDCESALQKYLE